MKFKLATCAAMLGLSACVVSPIGQPSVDPVAVGPAQFTPVRWKTGVDFIARATDRQECEAAAVGARPGMTEEQIFELTQSITQEQFIVFVDRCLSNKGYTVTDGRVCDERDNVLSDGQAQFILGRDADFLPPLSSVRCFDPERGGFVVQA